MAKYKLTLTKIIDADDPLMDFCFDDEAGKLASTELMADELKRMFDLGYVDALDVLQDVAWSVEEVGPPWTQAEIATAEAKVPALKAALGVESQCTCTPTCLSDCKGQCGCQVCHDAYMDFLSVE